MNLKEEVKVNTIPSFLRREVSCSYRLLTQPASDSISFHSWTFSSFSCFSANLMISQVYKKRIYLKQSILSKEIFVNME